MSGKSPRLKVGCVLPTNFDADVEFRIEVDGEEKRPFEHHMWQLVPEGQFLASIKRQMDLLREMWLKRTECRIDIEPKVATYDAPIKRIAMRSRELRQYKIKDPPRCELRRSLTDKGVRACFILIPFPQCLWKRVEKWGKPYQDGDYLWIPGSLEEERTRCCFRDGYSDELKHWVWSRLKKRSTNVCSPHKKERFWRELRRELTPEAVSYLCTGEWPEC